MARKSGFKPSKSSGAKAKKAPGARINKMETYEDTLEEGGVDDFMFKRDQIMFNPQDESDDDDVNGDTGEEVFSLTSSKSRRQRAEEEDQEEEDEGEDEEEVPQPKRRKDKVKVDLSGKGRFGKPIEDSDDDEEEDASGSGSDSEDDEEGWGRQYYSRPSNRREKEKEDEYDEKREEEREMEEREVRRLQRKAREGLSGDDWGLGQADTIETLPIGVVEVEEATPVVPVPTTSDPVGLIRHLEAYAPVKLALARDFPLVVRKLEKTARGIKKMNKEKDGEESLHKGLGWLHYQTLLTYATTLAFYLHIVSSQRTPDISYQAILQRLLELKQGVSMLEDLDFAAGSVSDGDPLLTTALENEDDDEDDEELMDGKRELLAKMLAGGSGFDMEDADDLWSRESLEDGELEEIMMDMDADDDEEAQLKDLLLAAKKRGKAKKAKKSSLDGDKKKKKNKDKKDKTDMTSTSFATLAEPEFYSSTTAKKSKKSTPAIYNDQDDTLGDPTSLLEADASDKAQRKRSLQFHTSKIAATSARRAAARAQRMSGDEDVPYRDRARARDAVLRRNGVDAVGEDLPAGGNAAEPEKYKKGKKRTAEDDEGDGDDAEGYYELVKRRRTEEKAAKVAEHEAAIASKLASFTDDTADGPRGLTRAIEKNRGLTPHRSKTGRNPRVKKRQAYEKAKQKVQSQRAVFKGGQASLGGTYKGEKTGISTTVKSRRF
ncbi:Sas10 C-terminal domain-domain-containing protein [Naematelia encephala]|uniref:Sas10 C-terminal domain-domain-containing protein n=1 Tax=Naematelia encephala TaxID=71784 RepID=A0A1Y2B6Y7_9TREE|nr:Sas10 C-terminal domain-domain-containing protein [Naematelia encephala]